MNSYFTEFGVHLVELTLDRNGPLPIRQLASVLLKQYVEAHWCTNSEKVSLADLHFMKSGYHETVLRVVD